MGFKKTKCIWFLTSVFTGCLSNGKNDNNLPGNNYQLKSISTYYGYRSFLSFPISYYLTHDLIGSDFKYSHTVTNISCQEVTNVCDTSETQVNRTITENEYKKIDSIVAQSTIAELQKINQPYPISGPPCGIGIPSGTWTSYLILEKNDTTEIYFDKQPCIIYDSLYLNEFNILLQLVKFNG